jgi:hypothetical protein
MAEVDAVLRELSEIQDRLNELPDDAFAEKYRLHNRRDELRAPAAEFVQDWDSDRPTEDLLRELAGLRARLAEAEKQKVDLVSQAGSGGPEGYGASGLGGVPLNQRIAQAQGTGDIQSRIGRIKGILIDRDVEIPD